MVTEFAKEMIKNADSCGAQDIYVIPRQDNYELYMRVGQERRLIDVYRPDFMASLIGHFKFVAGMMVGEKRRSQLVHVTMIVVTVTWFLCVYQLLETIEVWRAWLSVSYIPNVEN